MTVKEVVVVTLVALIVVFVIAGLIFAFMTWVNWRRMIRKYDYSYDMMFSQYQLMMLVAFGVAIVLAVLGFLINIS